MNKDEVVDAIIQLAQKRPEAQLKEAERLEIEGGSEDLG